MIRSVSQPPDYLISIKVILCVIAVLVTLLLGAMAGNDRIETQTVIVVFAGFVTLFLLSKGGDSHWKLLLIGVASLAFGHRGVYIGSYTYFIPLQVVVWVLWIVLLANGVANSSKFFVRVPSLLIFVVGWCLLRAIIAVIVGSNWDIVLSWTSPLIFGVPVFWVVNQLIIGKAKLESILRVILIVSGIMALLGCMQYFYPGFTRHLPGFSESPYLFTRDGFVRATFSFWGYPAAATVIAWGVLIALHELGSAKFDRWQLMALLTFFIGIVAVYISGQRSSWISLSVGLVVLSVFSQRRRTMVFMFIPIVGAVFSLDFWRRISTVAQIFGMLPFSDSSLAEHLSRWQWGVNSLLANPIWGIGYGHLLVHNAFLEIGSTIGVFPGIAFLLLVFQLIWRVGKVWRKGIDPDTRRYGLLFTSFSMAWIEQMLIGAPFNTVPFAAGHWVMMALGWYLPDILSRHESHQKRGESILRRSPDWTELASSDAYSTLKS